MSRLLICLFSVLVLASCNSQAVIPKYPLIVSAQVTVENEDVEYTADYNFSNSISSFVIKEPSMLNGLKITAVNDELAVSYNDIKLSYNIPEGVGFKAFKDLHNVLLLMNELQPEFSDNGENLYCEVDYKGETVRITADPENNSLDKIIINHTTYDFD